MTDPYYQDDHCTIYHGDCVDLLDELTFDAVVTDPPYGINAEHRPHAKGHGKAAAWDESVPYEMLPRFGEIPVFWFGHPSKMAEAYATFDPTPDRVFIWAPKFTSRSRHDHRSD